MKYPLRKTKGRKGSVQFKTSKGMLELVINPLVTKDGKAQRQRRYISTGLHDSAINRNRIGSVVALIQRDMDYGEVDLTLIRYKYALKQLTGNAGEILPSAEEAVERNLNLEELWDLYIEHKRNRKENTLSPTTFAKDYKRWRNHIEKLPTKRLEDAIAIYDYLLVNFSQDTARRFLVQLNACCSWAVQREMIQSNPFMSMRIDASGSAMGDMDINPFSREEIAEIIQAFSEDSRCSHYTNYVRFLFATGARPSEVIGLQWKHILENSIRFEQAVVISEEGLVVKIGLKDPRKKNRKRKREFPLNDELRDILEAARLQHPPSSPEDFIFRSPQGKILDQHNFLNRAWKPILSQCKNVKYRKSYQTRHTFITECAKENINSTVIGRWAGTSTQMIDRHYASDDMTDVVPPKVR